jgi:hypothetical protein
MHAFNRNSVTSVADVIVVGGSFAGHDDHAKPSC